MKAISRLINPPNPAIYLSLLLTLISCSHSAETEENTRTAIITPVKTAMVEKTEINQPIRATGMVESTNEARPSFKIGGVIARTLVQEGQFVKEGQLLATLQLTEITSQVQQALTALDKAKRDQTRVANLHADSVATLEQLQNTGTAVKLAEESLVIAQFNQKYAEVRAPMSGKVIKKLMNEGEIVGPGTPVYYILGTQAGDWVVKTGLSDRDWARTELGNKASITFDAYPGEPFEGQVKKLADTGTPGSGTFEAEVSILTKGKRMAAGLVADVQILPKSTSSLCIPIEALVETNGQSSIVFTLAPDGRVQKTTILIGKIIDNKVTVVSGLTQGQVIVTDGAPYLENGQLVSTIQ